MEKINVKIGNNDTDIDVLRYYEINSNKYLLFMNNNNFQETNTKIFVSKILKEKTVNIEDEEEWNEIKNSIVGIVNDNKELTKLDILDLNTTQILNIEITSARALILPTNIIEYISANRPLFNSLNTGKDAKLDEKTNDLRVMNQQLTNMMEEVENSISSEVKGEDELEIIMPSNGDIMEYTNSENIPLTNEEVESNSNDNYKEKYFKLIEENEYLKNHINNLEIKIKEINNKLNLIKNVVE